MTYITLRINLIRYCNLPVLRIFLDKIANKDEEGKGIHECERLSREQSGNSCSPSLLRRTPHIWIFRPTLYQNSIEHEKNSSFFHENSVSTPSADELWMSIIIHSEFLKY